MLVFVLKYEQLDSSGGSRSNPEISRNTGKYIIGKITKHKMKQSIRTIERKACEFEYNQLKTVINIPLCIKFVVLLN